MVQNLMSQPILRENKVTLYRLHPVEFGQVMTMPNLPNGLHEAEVYRKKGYKKDPQELDPDARLEKNPEGELFLIPKGYKLTQVDEMTEVQDGWRTSKSVLKPFWKVIPEKDENVCPECGKSCASALGLSSHLKSHK